MMSSFHVGDIVKYEGYVWKVDQVRLYESGVHTYLIGRWFLAEHRKDRLYDCRLVFGHELTMTTKTF